MPIYGVLRTSLVSWTLRRSTRFNRTTLLIPRLKGVMIRFLGGTGWRHGAISEVTLPLLPDVADRSAHASPHLKNTKASAAGLHTPSIADALARLGDGDRLDGFHRPLLAASMQYAIRVHRGGTRNDTELHLGPPSRD